MNPEIDPAQFYTGQIAELYEPLAGELACGSGTPLLELIWRGYEIEGQRIWGSKSCCT